MGVDSKLFDLLPHTQEVDGSAITQGAPPVAADNISFAATFLCAITQLFYKRFHLLTDIHSYSRITGLISLSKSDIIC